VLRKRSWITLRIVNKHLRYAIEDVGVVTPKGEMYYTCNPGYGWSLTEQNGGKFDNTFPDTPKAKREYWAVNLGIEKKFSDNWWGGASYTWSRLSGNYSGLASSDELGRNSPNVERYFAWGLTIGATASAMTGTPVSTEYQVWADGYFPFNRGDLGRTSFLMWADLYIEYALKIGPSEQNVPVSDADLLANSWELSDYGLRPDPKFMKECEYFPPISARLGLKFVF
jgi:hypothetical protein